MVCLLRKPNRTLFPKNNPILRLKAFTSDGPYMELRGPVLWEYRVGGLGVVVMPVVNYNGAAVFA